jgi:hypothetical protein
MVGECSEECGYIQDCFVMLRSQGGVAEEATVTSGCDGCLSDVRSVRYYRYRSAAGASYCGSRLLICE